MNPNGKLKFSDYIGSWDGNVSNTSTGSGSNGGVVNDGTRFAVVESEQSTRFRPIGSVEPITGIWDSNIVGRIKSSKYLQRDDNGRVGANADIKKIDIEMTVTANCLQNNGHFGDNENHEFYKGNGGEFAAFQLDITDGRSWSFMRTSTRIAIVKKKNLWDGGVQSVSWSTVFNTDEKDKGDWYDRPVMWGHRNMAQIDNIEVLWEDTIELSATNPQKHMRIEIGEENLGINRYVEVESPAGMLDEPDWGIFIVWCNTSTCWYPHDLWDAAYMITPGTVVAGCRTWFK